MSGAYGRRLLVPAVAIAAALGIGACGEEDFPNDPRPPAPVELTARIGNQKVVVSPSSVGAGQVTITVSNQSRDPAALTLDGPTDVVATELPPAAVGQLKTNLREGDYEVSAGPDSAAQATDLTVGPERKSSQNELLLP